MKRQNDRILKEELPRSVVAQYAAGDQWRNNSRKNEVAYWAPGVGDGQGGLVCCNSWGHKETWLSDWTELNWTDYEQKWKSAGVVIYTILK